MKIIILVVFLGLGGFLFLQQKEEPYQTPSKIQRIIAHSPAHTQMLDYLGLGDKIIAISQYDLGPRYQDREKIPGGVHIDEETILALRPDLLIIGESQQNNENIAFLESKGVQILTMNTTAFEDINQSLLDLQRLFPEEVSAQKVAQFQQEWENFQKNPITVRRTAFAILALDPVYSFSTNSYLHELYQYSGWDHIIATKSTYPVLTEEDLYRLPPVDDIIITVYLTNELPKISNIQKQIKAKNIVIISNLSINLASPYLLDIIKELRTIQSSLGEKN